MGNIKFLKVYSKEKIVFFEKPGFSFEWSRPKILVGKKGTLHFLPKFMEVPVMPKLTTYTYKAIVLPFWLGHLYFITWNPKDLEQ